MIDFIRETALKAGKKSLEYFGNLQAGDVCGKGTANDLVSIADKAVEDLIIPYSRFRYVRLLQYQSRPQARSVS